MKVMAAIGALCVVAVAAAFVGAAYYIAKDFAE